MISLPLAMVLAAAVLSTSFVSGVFGMAGGMILMGILLAMMPVAAAMVLHGLTQMASNGWRAWLWHPHIKWPVVECYAVGAVDAALADQHRPARRWRGLWRALHGAAAAFRCLKVVYFGRLLAGGDVTVAPVAVMLAILLAPVGTQLSRYVLEAMSDTQFRSWARCLIAVIAAACLAQGVFLFLMDLRAVA